MASIMISFHT